MSHLWFSRGCGFSLSEWEFHILIIILVEIQVYSVPSGWSAEAVCMQTEAETSPVILPTGLPRPHRSLQAGRRV